MQFDFQMALLILGVVLLLGAVVVVGVRSVTNPKNILRVGKKMKVIFPDVRSASNDGGLIIVLPYSLKPPLKARISVDWTLDPGGMLVQLSIGNSRAQIFAFPNLSPYLQRTKVKYKKTIQVLEVNEGSEFTLTVPAGRYNNAVSVRGKFTPVTFNPDRTEIVLCGIEFIRIA